MSSLPVVRDQAAKSLTDPASVASTSRRPPDAIAFIAWAVLTIGIERPVLQEDVDRLAERGRPCGEDCGGLELVVGPGKEDQVQRFIHCPTSKWLPLAA